MTAKASRLAKLGLSVAAGLLGLTLVMTVLAATGAAVAQEEQQHGVVLPLRVEGPDHPDAVVAASSVATVTVMANPTSILADGVSTSTITATLLNELGELVSDEDVAVIFYTDLGVLGSAMVTKTTSTGEATAVLTSTAAPGMATITATAESEFGVTQVYFSGETPCTVQVTAYRTVIPIGGFTSTITATVKDGLLHPIFDGQVVTFTTDLGILGSQMVTRTTSAGVATAVVTSEDQAGTSTITATAGSVKGTTEVVITDILPGDLYWVKATAHPASIPADGISTSIITATLLDVLDQPVTDETTVTFTTNLGRLGTSDWVTGTTTSGVVTATLTSGTTPGTAMIHAWADDKFGLTYVTFTPTGTPTPTATPTPTPTPTATPTATPTPTPTPAVRLFLPLVTKGFH